MLIQDVIGLPMLTIEDIIEATGGAVLAPGGATAFTGVSIDSRTVKRGELFIALRGDRFDGHDFVADALKTAAAALVNRDAQCAPDGTRAATVIAVDDTLRALQDLARFLRKKFGGSVVAVVGSNGKTTTKELLASILGTRWNVLKTAGNLNNHIGMPLSLARITEATEALVLEMGTNRPGDVKELCDIGLPDTGVVTNIGYEHIEGFGSLERVRDEELAIAPYVKRLAVNADDRFLMDGMAAAFGGVTTTFGIDAADARVRATDISYHDDGTSFTLVAGNERTAIASRLAGRFNVYNALAAAAAAHALGFSAAEMKRGIEAFGGVALRLEIKRLDGVTYLNDSYNANPSSMEASLAELARRVASEGEGAGAPRAVAVLGDMLELGDFGIEAHRRLGERLAALPVALFIAVGPLMAHAAAAFAAAFGGTALALETSDDAARELARLVRRGDLVLIKGSRGMRMEKVMAAMEQRARGGRQ